MFQRREDVSEVGEVILRPRLGFDGQAVRTLAPGDRSPPFAVAAVEHQDGVARGKPQHIAEIIAVVAFQRDGPTFAQRGVDEQARAAEVQFRHS